MDLSRFCMCKVILSFSYQFQNYLLSCHLKLYSPDGISQSVLAEEVSSIFTISDCLIIIPFS
jgi:hypothetical protein